nr:MAG TPA: hypothetical protein [Caudoviricetes sp.]
MQVILWKEMRGNSKGPCRRKTDPKGLLVNLI